MPFDIQPNQQHVLTMMRETEHKNEQLILLTANKKSEYRHLPVLIHALTER